MRFRVANLHARDRLRAFDASPSVASLIVVHVLGSRQTNPCRVPARKYCAAESSCDRQSAWSFDGQSAHTPETFAILCSSIKTRVTIIDFEQNASDCRRRQLWPASRLHIPLESCARASPARRCHTIYYRCTLGRRSVRTHAVGYASWSWAARRPFITWNACRSLPAAFRTRPAANESDSRSCRRAPSSWTPQLP